MSDATPRFVIAAWPEGTRADDAPTCRCGSSGPLDAKGRCSRCWATDTIVREVLVELGAARRIDPRGPGIIGSHWIEPSPLVANRPRNAVTSAAPPEDEKP